LILGNKELPVGSNDLFTVSFIRLPPSVIVNFFTARPENDKSGAAF
jgi:hypothetical protein